MDSDRNGELPKVRFVYQKARHHRTLHADGAWAAVTPQLEVQFALFNDLRMMPPDVTHLVTEEGGIGNELTTEQASKILTNVLHEVDVTIVVNKDVAKNLIAALTQMVEQIDAHIEKSTGASADALIDEQGVS